MTHPILGRYSVNFTAKHKRSQSSFTRVHVTIVCKELKVVQQSFCLFKVLCNILAATVCNRPHLYTCGAVAELRKCALLACQEATTHDTGKQMSSRLRCIRAVNKFTCISQQ